MFSVQKSHSNLWSNVFLPLNKIADIMLKSQNDWYDTDKPLLYITSTNSGCLSCKIIEIKLRLSCTNLLIYFHVAAKVSLTGTENFEHKI